MKAARIKTSHNLHCLNKNLVGGCCFICSAYAYRRKVEQNFWYYYYSLYSGYLYYACTVDILFDIAVAGPIAGLVVAVVVVIFGAWTSPVIDSQVAEDLMMGSTLFPMNENLIMKGALALFDKDGTEVEVIMSPILML